MTIRDEYVIRDEKGYMYTCVSHTHFWLWHTVYTLLTGKVTRNF